MDNSKRSALWLARDRARELAYVADPSLPANSVAPFKRIKSCGYALVPVGVRLSPATGHLSVSGVVTCGSVWQCPSCAYNILARRRGDLITLFDAHEDAGGSIGMLTLTMRHARDNATGLFEPLTSLLSRLNDQWRYIQGLSSMRALNKMLSGKVSTIEITYSEEGGWHPHLHIILLSRPGVSRSDISRASDALRVVWSKLVNEKTDRYSILHGLDFRWFNNAAKAATYVSKTLSAALEITSPSTKENTSPFRLLQNDDPLSVALWLEYVRATHKRQLQRWSKGLRALYALPDDVSDDLLADDDIADDSVLVAMVAPFHWNSLSVSLRLVLLEALCLEYRGSPLRIGYD